MWRRARKNFWKIQYTQDHRSAVRFCYYMLVGYVPIRARLHDIDKIIMLYLGIKPETVSKLHRRFAQHHNMKTKDPNVLLEIIVDWESARMSKPDKPLNARETMEQYYPEMKFKLEPILKELGL